MVRPRFEPQDGLARPTGLFLDPAQQRLRDAPTADGGARMDEVVFITNYAFDCIVAKSAGMLTAFIDRCRLPFGETPHQPDLIVPTMQDLADALV